MFNFFDVKDNLNIKLVIKRVIAVIVLIVGLVNQPFKTVPAGERGVLLTFGKADEQSLDSGLHAIIPFVQKIVLTNVQVQKMQNDLGAASKDLQDVHTTLAVNFRVIPDKASIVYRDLGVNFEATVIAPAMNEVFKAVASQYTAVELITKREQVKDEAVALLKKRLLGYNVDLVDMSIVNFGFSPGFTKSIEEKQEAEQKALKAQRDLERIKTEAEQKIAEAHGQAESNLAIARAQAEANLTLAKAQAQANELQNKTITPEIIKIREIEKWDGVLPRVNSGVVPFIDVNSEK